MTPGERDAVLARLGPDPLAKKPDGSAAFARITRSKTTIGALLMDQKVLAGVGNVYRAEVLFRNHVSPFRPGNAVGEQAWQAMWDDLVVLMKAGVRPWRRAFGSRIPVSRATRSVISSKMDL